MPVKAIGWRIRGRVQGVGFRHFVCKNARALGLRGWVQNMQDGSVRAAASGGERELAELEKALHDGPSMSVVESVEIEPTSPALEDETTFRIV